MKTAVTLADAAQIGDPREEVFDLYQAYAETVLSDPAREKECAERQGYFHPSAIGMCARMNVYGARQEPFTIHHGVQDIEIFQYGHGVHDRVQSVLEQVDRVAEKKGLLWTFKREVRYDPKKDRLFADLRTGGTCDGEIEIEKPGEWKQRGVLEVKSMKDEYWQELKGPKTSHLLQAHLYAFRFDCPIIWFWYFNKNSGLHRVFPYAFDPEIFAEAIERLEMLNHHLDNGTLPDREESWYLCKRCEYKDVCDPDVVKPRQGRQQPRSTTIAKKKLLQKARRTFRKGGK